MKKNFKSEVDLLIEEFQEEEKYFKNYLRYAKEIKKEAEKILGGVRVFVFGSILKKDEVPQDIDILILSSKFKKSFKKTRVRIKLLKKIGKFSPFELHLITPQEYKDWYRHFIDEKIEVK